MNNFTMMLISGFICALIVSPWWAGALFGAIFSLIVAAAMDGIVYLLKRTDITADRILTELAKIGFSDIRRAVKWQSSLITEEDNPEGGDVAVIKNIVTNNVQLVASDDIDDDTAAAVAEISQNAQGGLKIKLHDKRAALVDMGRHLGMFKDKIEHTGNISLIERRVVRPGDPYS